MTPRRPQSHPMLAAASLALALPLLGGCFAETTAGALIAGGGYLALHPEKLPLEDFSNVRQQREPIVSPVRYAHQIHFAKGRAGLDSVQRARLDDFVGRLRLTGTDEVYIAGGLSDEDFGSPKANRLAQRRIGAVTALMELQGLPVHVARVGALDITPDMNAVILVVRRHVVTLPACPDWSGKPGRSWNNQTSSNWSCADSANLGMMVADPRHLARGQAMGPADPDHAVLAIQRYRADDVRPLDPEDVGVVDQQQKTGQQGEDK